MIPGGKTPQESRGERVIALVQGRVGSVVGLDCGLEEGKRAGEGAAAVLDMA